MYGSKDTWKYVEIKEGDYTKLLLEIEAMMPKNHNLQENKEIYRTFEQEKILNSHQLKFYKELKKNRLWKKFKTWWKA